MTETDHKTCTRLTKEVGFYTEECGTQCEI